MATFKKRGDLQWRVKIRRREFPVQTKTFEPKAEGQAWARGMKSDMDRGIFRASKEAEWTTMTEALDKYLEEVSIHKRAHSRKKKRIEK